MSKISVPIITDNTGKEIVNALNTIANNNTKYDELSKSVSDGKTAIAAAITEMGVNTSAAGTFSDLANNIKLITTGIKTSIQVNVDSGSVVTAVNKNTGETITATAVNNVAVINVPEAGTYEVAALLNGKTSNTVTVKVNGVYDEVLYYADPILNNNSWDTISKISSLGLASSIWSTGDTKTVSINGTIQGISFNVNVDAYIIGFNHNSELEGNGIHFKLGKINEKQIAFLDPDNYGNESTSFSMYGEENDSKGSGWPTCQMRTTILGNNGTNTPTNPKENTFLAALPGDLRKVMKSVTKYTCTYSDSNTVNIASTKDYLFLLSEHEVFGYTEFSSVVRNSGSTKFYSKHDHLNIYIEEKIYQEQYKYYKNGNSFIHRNYTTESKVNTILRTLYAYQEESNDYFIDISADSTKYAPTMDNDSAIGGSSLGSYTGCFTSTSISPAFVV